MQQYLVKRLIAAGAVLFGVTLLVFTMVRLVPGDPVDIMFANQPPPTPEQRAALRRQLGLDLPIYRQYLHFLSRALRGDLGRSFRSKQPVTREILTRLPNTLKLTVASLTVALLTGVSAGILAAVFRGSWIDTATMLLAVLGVSLPSFWLGLMLILLFAVHLGWFPVSGAASWRHLVLPAVTLGVLTSGILARLMRSSLLDELSRDYVRTARAKGLREATILTRHVLRNALIPVVTIVGLQLGQLLSGAVIIEAVFAYPGIGLLAVNALQARDFPLIQGIVLFVAVVYVLVNLAVDLLYCLIDPRVSYA
ncbi:ABC transporter permease [Thermomicrobium sp. CFH 73360]|uniref:nickel ABC transporter permease n=1 Tax=Thermomicrobium sp. CFH 73360 TaxID=2951987 RepID=UPI002076DB23|nr:nickel ABC transporter permease [Thermomicrobium sp. CFH 73360]MCM8747405.1 ABC transporter permease [Thermomicrobium sp. CFH 73360]